MTYSMERSDQLTDYIRFRLKRTIERIPEFRQTEFLLEFCKDLDDDVKANLLKDWNHSLKNRHLNCIRKSANQYEL